jgi:hypothetical protein
LRNSFYVEEKDIVEVHVDAGLNVSGQQSVVSVVV